MESLNNSGYVIADRGGVIENRHAVHAAVVDESGRLLFAVGDPRRVTLARSAAKPAQALAILETGAAERFGFDEADLALMCASHNSEDRHINRARAMLAKAQVAETDLRCGGHPSISDKVNRKWIKNDFSPTAVYNNCSGKHAGMLGGARAIGASVDGYHLGEHPMQQRVKDVFEDLCGLEGSDVIWVTDGCNLPAPAVPLCHTARLYATFASAADVVGAQSDSIEARTQRQASIFQAMSRYPELVGGEGRFCTILAEEFKGALVGKLGADGFYGVSVRASEHTRRLGAESAIGIAVKIEDGSLEVLYTAVMEILKQLQLTRPGIGQELSIFHQPERINTAGLSIGKISNDFKVQAC